VFGTGLAGSVPPLAGQFERRAARAWILNLGCCLFAVASHAHKISIKDATESGGFLKVFCKLLQCSFLRLI